MKIQIKATEITLTPAIKDYAEKKILSLQKYFQNEEDVLAFVEIGKTTQHHKSGEVFKAEVSIRAKGTDHYSVSEKSDLYAAIDDVKDEIARSIVSSKKKKETLFRKGGAKIKELIKRLNWKNYE